MVKTVHWVVHPFLSPQGTTALRYQESVLSFPNLLVD
uniref:Uncharacterized protein n=1 Tax=Amphimedon queenslandica TaxID=400682 RepID=A0A1X7TZQ9_AMPQE